MLLNELPEDKKQFNIKLYTSMIDWIENEAKRHNTTATNVVRHALNLSKRLEELTIVLTEFYTMCDDNIDDKTIELRGYAIREEFAEVIKFIPLLPKAPRSM